MRLLIITHFTTYITGKGKGRYSWTPEGGREERKSSKHPDFQPVK